MASEYGYTFDEFRGLTLRQVHISLCNINARLYNTRAFQAALNGIKLKTPKPSGAHTKSRFEFTKKHDDLAEKGLHLAMARKAQEFKTGG